jgi:rubredoxin
MANAGEGRLRGETFKYKVTYRVKIEACGFETYRCPFCKKVYEKRAALLSHLETRHVDVVITYYHTAELTVLPHKKHHNVEFPLWSGTTVTDYTLNDWLVAACEKSVVGTQMVMSLVAVECHSSGTKRYYCSLCGHESEPSKTIQQEHFLSAHVTFEQYRSRTRHMIC